MGNGAESNSPQEEYSSQWYEHSESVSHMSQEELHDVARKAVHLFFSAVTQSRDQNKDEREKLHLALEAAAPEVEYLFLRMTAGDRLSDPSILTDESPEQYRVRGRGIAAMVAARFTGYVVTPEDWPLP